MKGQALPEVRGSGGPSPANCDDGKDWPVSGRASFRIGPLAKRLVVYVVLVGIYLILHRYVEKHEVVAALFAAGPHLQTGTVMLACSFVALRLFVVLLLPAFVGGFCTRWIMDRLFPKHENILSDEASV